MLAFCCLFAFVIDFGRFLIDFGFVFGTILGSKLDPKSSSKLNKFLDRFFMILARFGGPSCGHVGDIFGKKGGAVKCSCVCCWVVAFFRILVCLGRVWILFSAYFRGMGFDFWCDAGTFCLPLLAPFSSSSISRLGAPCLMCFGFYLVATTGAAVFFLHGTVAAWRYF